MSWYNRYRPTSVAGLHLQSVRDSLSQMVERGLIPQVMLLAGPKGTGKTSTARIVAAMLNDPANQAVVDSWFSQAKAVGGALTEPDPSQDLVQRIRLGSSLVVHELDAASHRGIDDVRALKERAALPPQEGTAAVYILDEAHMLTTEAFNALLKLLEEPPAHTFFMLATTELHKIPATIVSRCAVIRFTKASTAELTTALQTIVEQEDITADPAALQLIAERADGSFRDAVKWAELVFNEAGELNISAVERLVQKPVTAEVQQLVQAITSADSSAVVQLFETLRQQAVPVEFFEHSVCDWLHQTILQNLSLEEGQPAVSQKVAQFLLQEFLPVCGMKNSPIAHLPLELKALELIQRSQDKRLGGGGSSKAATGNGKVVVSKSVTEAVLFTPPVIDDETLNSEQVEPVAEVLAETVADEAPIAEVTSIPELNLANQDVADPQQARHFVEQWPALVAGVKQRNSTLAALLNSAQPTLTDDGRAQVHVYYQFHKDQLQQPKFRQVIEASVKDVMGAPVAWEVVLSPPVMLQPTTSASAESVPDSAASSPATLTTLAAQALV